MLDERNLQVVGRVDAAQGSVARVDLSVQVAGGHRITASLYAPVGHDPTGPALYFFPGGGYSRRYFDLPAPGYSQVAHASAAGLTCITIDTLGVGESNIPPPSHSDVAAVTSANSEAIEQIDGAMRRGLLCADGRPLMPSCRIGIGQSMGGFIVTHQQARHRSFDAVALLGASAVATRLPVHPDRPVPPVSANASADTLAAHAVASLDWAWAFHWEEASDSAGRALREQDIAAGLPARHHEVPWGSATMPGLVNSCMAPGVLREAASAVDVPVLLCMGERDVCQSVVDEVGAFWRAPDVAAVVFGQMAHMHNFAPTRQQLWQRLTLFARQVAAMRGTGF